MRRRFYSTAFGIHDLRTSAKVKLLLLVLLLAGCASSRVERKEWTERGAVIGGNRIDHGIPVYGASKITYAREGGRAATITLGEPVVIDVATKEEKWGFFQFPDIHRSADGSFIFATWSMAADAIRSYGKGGRAYFLSRDGGKTWSPMQTEPVGGGLVLPNGERIAIDTPEALNVEDLDLPDSIGFTYVTTRSSSNGYAYYRVTELPDKLQGVYIKRARQGEKHWVSEHATLNDPQLLRYTRTGLFPVVWWGDLQLEADGSIITGVYPTPVEEPSGKIKPSGISFYRSSNGGRSWDLVSRLPYVPDLSVDPDANTRLLFGWTEPAFEILKNGTYVTVLRTNGPMYISRSGDKCKTWSAAKPFTQNGVLPRLLELENGVTVLSSGRPGVQLRFSWDGNCEEWTDPFEMLPFAEDKSHVSCGYTGLLSTGPNKFLIIYSDFKYRTKAGEIRKAIKVREVTVNPHQSK